MGSAGINNATMAPDTARKMSMPLAAPATENKIRKSKAHYDVFFS
jgi:hypothetical protein